MLQPLQDCQRSWLRRDPLSWCDACSSICCQQRHAADPLRHHAAAAQAAEPPAAGSYISSARRYAASAGPLGGCSSQRQLDWQLHDDKWRYGRAAAVVCYQRCSQLKPVHVLGSLLCCYLPGVPTEQKYGIVLLSLNMCVNAARARLTALKQLLHKQQGWQLQKSRGCLCNNMIVRLLLLLLRQAATAILHLHMVSSASG